jgi:hypothetical protein
MPFQIERSHAFIFYPISIIYLSGIYPRPPVSILGRPMPSITGSHFGPWLQAADPAS